MQSCLKLATYNIHRCTGIDGVFNPDRTSKVIQELDADIIALQEVESVIDSGGNILYHITTGSGFTTIPGPTMYRRDSGYGNAVLSRYRPVTIVKEDISQPNLEPRGVISLLFDFNGVMVHILSTHLGLRAGERKLQINSIFNVIKKQPSDITILMGDMNEWLPCGRISRKLSGYFGGKFLPATFPSRFPLFSLDQIRVRPDKHVTSTEKLKSPLSIAASDHLPLSAELRF